MSLIKRFIADIIQRPSLYFFVFLIIFTFDRHHRYEGGIGDSGTLTYDVAEYYRYLPNVFYHDVEEVRDSIMGNQRTIGMAIMYSPSFLVGHLLAKAQGVEQNGYTLPYQWAIRWGSIIYVLIGLFFCRKSLLLFFSELTTLIALVATFFATNLFFYTYSWGEMSHGYLFFLYAIFIYLAQIFIREKKFSFLPWLFFVGGYITLVRPTCILVFLFPLLYDVWSLNDIKARFQLLFSKPLIAAAAFLAFWFPLFLQMLIWKKYTGYFIHYSYGEQGFFFNDPQIFNFLLSIRKGWLVYTPVMAFALVGIVMCFKRLKEFFIFLVVYFPLTVYILSSWFDWSYGGSFGCRALVESYAFFIFPMAVFINVCWEWMAQRKVINTAARVLLLSSILFFADVNLIQVGQLKYGFMHWDGNTVETYKFLFLREEFSEADKAQLKYLYSKFKRPSSAEMIKGKRDY